MLTDKDIQFMNSTRKQITQGRTTPVKLTYEIENGVDEWTGEVFNEVIVIDAEAIVTETSGGGASDLQVIAGAVEDRSDIQVSISLDQLEGYENERPHRLEYRGELYSVQALDREGVGEANRLELTARKAAL